MAFNKYYQDELTFLRELGKEFARKNSKLAPFLAEPRDDPDVERLLEGFCFLTGRLRQKLEDEFPELTHSLFALLWPNFLRPIPSLSVLQFKPIPGAISGRKTIKKGISVDSEPVDGTRCRFQTCYDVDLYPLELDQVDLQHTAAGSRLRLEFALASGSAFEHLSMDSLRLYLHGEFRVSSTLYLWLCRYLERIEINVPDGTTPVTLPATALHPLGFDEAEAVLPYPANGFSGYRLLQEYFTFPEKFLFLEVTGLSALTGLAVERRFEMVFHFKRPFEDRFRVTQEHVHLYCTPIINLFAQEAHPLQLDQKKVEYRIRPVGADPLHSEIYVITHVEGLLQGSGKRRRYKAFESFDHGVEEADEPLKRPLYYRTRLYPSVVEGRRRVDTYISFVTGQGDPLQSANETLSLELICSNGRLAEQLRPRAICQATGNSPEFATFCNLSRVTPFIPPPLEQGLDWQLISNLSLNYGSLTNLEALRHVLGSYDFGAYYDSQAKRERQLRLEGIVRMETMPQERLFKGLSVRGLRTYLEVRESNFAGEGDIYLFGSVLSTFFALYANLNAFHQLVVKGLEQGEIYEWPPIAGKQPLL
jgi:type VI secretion system protein ImpG